MTELKNQNNYYKCPFCACLFFNQSDLNKHIETFGNNKADHEYNYKKAHARIEHSYNDE